MRSTSADSVFLTLKTAITRGWFESSCVPVGDIPEVTRFTAERRRDYMIRSWLPDIDAL